MKNAFYMKCHILEKNIDVFISRIFLIKKLKQNFNDCYNDYKKIEFIKLCEPLSLFYIHSNIYNLIHNIEYFLNKNRYENKKMLKNDPKLVFIKEILLNDLRNIKTTIDACMMDLKDLCENFSIIYGKVNDIY